MLRNVSDAVGRELEVVHGQHDVQPELADLVAPRDERLRHVRGGLGIGEVRRAADLEDRLVGKRHHAAGAPEQILGPRVVERRVGVLRLPALGPEEVGLEAPDGRQVGIVHLQPRPHVEAERDHRDERRPRLPDVLVAGARALGARAAAAQRRAEVDQVVAQDLAAADVLQEVARVDGAAVVVVQPGAEHAHRAQLAAMFVRMDVVGIVGPRAVVLERADVPAGDALAGDHAIAAVGAARRLQQQRVDVGLGHRPRAAVLVVEHRVGRDAQVVAAERSPGSSPAR